MEMFIQTVSISDGAQISNAPYLTNSISHVIILSISLEQAWAQEIMPWAPQGNLWADGATSLYSPDHLPAALVHPTWTHTSCYKHELQREAHDMDRPGASEIVSFTCWPTLAITQLFCDGWVSFCVLHMEKNEGKSRNAWFAPEFSNNYSLCAVPYLCLS